MLFSKKYTGAELFARANDIIGSLTPLRGHDCGQLCGCACCVDDGMQTAGLPQVTGMRLFPGEPTSLNVVENENGRFVVCGGRCDRDERPLACRIFPFYPTLDEDGEVVVMIDGRGAKLCPLVRVCDNVDFDPRFFRAVGRVGKLLAGDPACAAEMRAATDEISVVNELVLGNE